MSRFDKKHIALECILPRVYAYCLDGMHTALDICILPRDTAFGYLHTYMYMCMGTTPQDPSAAHTRTLLQRPCPPVLLFDVEFIAAVQARPCSGVLVKSIFFVLARMASNSERENMHAVKHMFQQLLEAPQPTKRHSHQKTLTTVLMSANIYTYIYMYIYICTYIHICTRTCGCQNTLLRTFISPPMYIWIYLFILYIHVHIFLSRILSLSIYIHINEYVYIYRSILSIRICTNKNKYIYIYIYI